jgi:hypothetical protein
MRDLQRKIVVLWKREEIVFVFHVNEVKRLQDLNVEMFHRRIEPIISMKMEGMTCLQEDMNTNAFVLR